MKFHDIIYYPLYFKPDVFVDIFHIAPSADLVKIEGSRDMTFMYHCQVISQRFLQHILLK